MSDSCNLYQWIYPKEMATDIISNQYANNRTHYRKTTPLVVRCSIFQAQDTLEINSCRHSLVTNFGICLIHWRSSMEVCRVSKSYAMYAQRGGVRYSLLLLSFPSLSCSPQLREREWDEGRRRQVSFFVWHFTTFAPMGRRRGKWPAKHTAAAELGRLSRD